MRAAPAEGTPQRGCREDGMAVGDDSAAGREREIDLDGRHHERVAAAERPLQQLPVGLAHKHLAQLRRRHPAQHIESPSALVRKAYNIQ